MIEEGWEMGGGGGYRVGEMGGGGGLEGRWNIGLRLIRINFETHLPRWKGGGLPCVRVGIFEYLFFLLLSRCFASSFS